MRFNMKLDEIQYIQKQFHFNVLLGVEASPLINSEVEKKLKCKGVVVEQENQHPELSNEYRYLFSVWERMRYSVIRPDDNLPNTLFCVFAVRRFLIRRSELQEEMVEVE